MARPIVLFIIVVVSAVSVTCLPMNFESPAADLPPQKIGNNRTLTTNVVSNDENGMIFAAKVMLPPNGKTPDTDLIRRSTLQKMNISTTLTVINLNAVKNKTAVELNELLHNDVVEKLPEEIQGRLPFLLLLIKDGDGNVPVNLNEVAKDLEGEGFAVEKVVKDDEIRLIKVNLDLVKTAEEISNKGNTPSSMLQQKTGIQECGVLPSIRRKRDACIKCTIVVKKNHKRGNRGGRGGRGRCRGGCGRGGGYNYPQPAYHQIVYQTVYQYPQPTYSYPTYQYAQPQYHPQPQPQPQPQYHPQPQPQYHPQPQPQPQHCNTCQGGYGNGGSTATAQASAQASASSSSGGYGR